MNCIYNMLNKATRSAFTYTMLLFFCIVSIPSCTDILDKVPLDRYSDAVVWQDETLVSAFVSNTYRSMPTGFQAPYSFAALACLGCYTDEGEALGDGFDAVFNAGNVLPTDLSVLNYWGRYYNVIGRCNIFLDRIQTSMIDEAIKSRMTGEIKVLRAFAYSRLIAFHGGVPLVDKPLTLDDDLNLPRSSYDDIVDFIVTDLDEAAALLPEEYDAANKGRITRGAALAVKSRVLLYWASPLNNTGNDMSRWQLAADAAKAVIDMNQYELYPDYRVLFLQETAYNSEIIWSRPYNSLVDFEGVAVEMFLYPPGSNGRAGISPIHNLVKDYETVNGLLPEDDPEYDPQDPYVNRDPRFYATILYDGAIFKGREIEIFLPGGLDSDIPSVGGNTVPKPGYYLRKFNDETITDPIQQRIGSTPWTFFRYAEILLNYAEANYFLGNEPIARQYINMVRSRPGVEMPDVTESGDALLKEIRNERRIELAFEEHRFFDVRRWKIATEVLNVNAQKMTVHRDPGTGVKTYIVEDFLPARAFFERNYLLPIPQDEMDKNPLFEQNPGY